jgi:hypothetical protein
VVGVRSPPVSGAQVVLEIIYPLITGGKWNLYDTRGGVSSASVAKLNPAKLNVVFVEDAREIDSVKAEPLRGALNGFVLRPLDLFRRDIYVFAEVFDHMQHDRPRVG